MSKHSWRYPKRRTQRGTVLFVALIFLILLTLLGLTAASTSVLQERMTGGMRNSQMGLMGAESALRGGEYVLWIAPETSAKDYKLSLFCSTDGTGGCYAPLGDGSYASAVQTFRTTTTWISSGGTGYTPPVSGLGSGTASASLADQPQYLIQMVGPDLPPGTSGRTGASLQQQGGGIGDQTLFIYTITARSTGGTANVVRAAESTFAAIKAQY